MKRDRNLRFAVATMAAMLLIVSALAFYGIARGQTAARLDWSNDIAQEMDEEQIADIQGFGMYIWSARSIWTEAGWRNARAVAGDASIIVTIDLLHCFLPDYYLITSWPWIQAQGELLAGSHALNIDGQPCARWKDASADSLAWKYHVDPRRTRPEDYAALIVEWIAAYGADGIILDYLAQNPWTYPEDPMIDFDAATTWLWRGYEIMVVYQLRRMLGEDFIILANGEWAMSEPRLTQPQLLSGAFWERCGSLWWTPDQWLELIRDRPGLQVYGGRQIGPKADGWDLYRLSRAAGILEQQAYVEIRR